MNSYSSEIQRNRFHSFTLNTNCKSQDLTLRLKKHRYLFGSNIFGTVSLEGKQGDLYRQRIKDIWNAGTLPFYWGRFEEAEGKPDPGDRVIQAARWGKEQGFSLKGHPLCWHTLAPDWLMEYNKDRLLGKVQERIQRDVDRFKGIIDCWDVINEVVIMPIFDKYDNAITRLCNHMGAENLVLECFKAVREVNPEAMLLINDFNLSPDYEALLERLLDKGCTIDAIGLQTHQHTGYLEPEGVEDILHRFSRFNLPMHFTEITILSGKQAPPVDDLNDITWDEWPTTAEGEQKQMEQMEEFYSQIYAHPLTEAMVWWDIQDGNWLKAPAGLLREDLSPKPSYLRLRELIQKAWGFPKKNLRTDDKGILSVQAPEGEYELVLKGKSYNIFLDKNEKAIDLRKQPV